MKQMKLRPPHVDVFSPSFVQALRSVLPDTDDMSDEDLGVLFMKIDANGSGEVDWDEFTGFLLQARSELFSHGMGY